MSRSLSIKLDASMISKVLFLLYMVYSNVTSYSLFFVRGLSSILLFGALACQLLNDNFRLKKNNSLIALVIFGIYVVASGIVVAQNYDRVITTAMTYGECLIVFYLVLCYILKDGKPDYPMLVFIAQALIAAFFTIRNGYGLYRISISEEVNVNTVGVMFALAIGFIMYLLISDRNKPIKITASLVAILVLLFAIMLTASKKAIITGMVFIVLWIFFCYRFTFARLPRLIRTIILIALFASGVYIFIWYTTNYSLQFQIVRNRMSQLYVGNSDQLRVELIKEGFSIFLEHPIFGVGFNNARYYTSANTYTHCFYSELFACTGIIGSTVFIYAILNPWMMIRRIRSNIKKGLTLESIQSIYILILLIVLLALCVAQILFYTPNLMYIFAIVTGYAALAQFDKTKYNPTINNISNIS